MALLQRLQSFFTPPTTDEATAALYRACVTQARQPVFYQELGVPDTVDGRFDLLLLHIVLVMRRLAHANEAKQKLFDFMFADMDRSLREMGIGDMSIGKKIKPMISAFYGRAQAYDRGLGGEEDLVAALERNIYGKVTPQRAQVEALASYVQNVVASLESQVPAALVDGNVSFTAPVLGSI